MKISRSRGWVVLLIAVGLAGLAGCGDTSAQSPAPSAAAPEDQRASAAAVAEGMRTIDQLAKDIVVSAGTDQDRAVRLSEQIEPAWRPIEGTVKVHEPDAYLAMEDSFAVLQNAAQNGDAAAAAKGANTVSTTVQEYLARYPG